MTEIDKRYEGKEPIGRTGSMQQQYTHNLVNNEAFFSIVPYPYKEYYRKFVKESLRWYDGYVPYFHNEQSGMFSTNLAHTITSKLARIIAGQKILLNKVRTKSSIKNTNYKGRELNSIELLETWIKDNRIDTKKKQGQEWALAAGDAAFKVDNVRGELKVDIFRKDWYFFNTDFHGELIDATFFLSRYTNLNKDEQTVPYYLLEEREYDENGKPQIRLTVKQGQQQTTQAKQMSLDHETVNWENLPKKIKDRISKDFPKSRIGEWNPLPLKDLGVYIIKASERISFMPNLPYGESMITRNIHIFMSYDFYYSALNTDLYLGRGKVLMPKSQEPPNRKTKQYEGMEDYMLRAVSYLNASEQKPLPIQFDLRTTSWKEARDILLQSLATNEGINERTIANFLTPASEKPSAHEISSDENDTTSYVEEKRPLLKEALDGLFSTVLDFYSFDDQIIEAKFSRAGLTNFANVVQQTSVLKQNGLGDRRTLLEKIYYDKSSEEIDLIEKRLKEEEQEKMLNEQPQQENNEEPNDLKDQDNKDYQSKSLSQVEKPKE